METIPASNDRCARCRGEVLSVLYYGADGEPVGGHTVCTECGPRSVIELPAQPAEVRRRLLERKAS